MEFFFLCICKKCAKINPAHALRPSRSIVPLLLIYPVINPTFLMKRKTFLMGAGRGSSPVPQDNGPANEILGKLLLHNRIECVQLIPHVHKWDCLLILIRKASI
jgi:hypothetical protein